MIEMHVLIGGDGFEIQTTAYAFAGKNIIKLSFFGTYVIFGGGVIGRNGYGKLYNMRISTPPKISRIVTISIKIATIGVILS